MIANGLNRKEFRYSLLSYTGYGFGLKKSEFHLKQGRKISDFCLKQGQGMRGPATPSHQRISSTPSESSSFLLNLQMGRRDLNKGI